jgi:Tol biopolymer transport system component
VTLVSGSRLGPYEILAPLGAGGMGEVYRAKDPRLGREVAIKVLPPSFSTDADRLRRFEQEARAAGILNHPNITAVYDIGSVDDAPYVVTELLEGETLRSALSGGALAPRRAIDYAVQIARGLAAAHGKGIVHRDLKPENLFVTRDGRVKILDFGLAKLTQPEDSSAQTNLPTATAGTEPGVVLGTLGYMSPEQVRGRPADARSDIFSFGTILYEMLSGKRAFHGDSAADTMSAILREDPPELSATNQSINPGLDRVVRHCLEKTPEQRFHSAHDLAFDLEALSGLSGATSAHRAVADRGRAWRVGRLVALAALVAVGAAGLLAGRLLLRGKPIEPPTFERLTFRRGNILTARFAPDGETVVFGASWGGNPVEIFSTHAGSPEYRSLGLKNADVLAISSTGELALSLREKFLVNPTGVGKLARVPLAGGVPREVLEEVEAADWTPDGKDLLVIREQGARDRIEFPPGKVLYESAPPIFRPRFSPDGERIAFIQQDRDGRKVMLVDRKGAARALSKVHSRVVNLAWAPSGREVWFDARDSIRAVDLSGRERVIVSAPGSLYLHDISPAGRVLVEQAAGTSTILFGSEGIPAERDLSWFDRSAVVDLSDDGATLLFNDRGPRGETSFYLRRTDGSAAVRLGEGIARGLSPDGRFVLAAQKGPPEKLVVVPAGTGSARELDRAGIETYGDGQWTPDGRAVLFEGRTSRDRGILYLQDVAGGKPRAIASDGFATGGRSISPDGKWVIVFRGWSEGLFLLPLAGGEPKPIPDSAPFDPVRWSADGRSLYVFEFGRVPLRVHRLDPFTGRRAPWKTLAPADLVALTGLGDIAITADGRSYAYTFGRAASSDLYLLEGAK